MSKGSYYGVPIEQLSREELEDALVKMHEYYLLRIKDIMSDAEFLREVDLQTKNVKPGIGWL